MTCHPPPVTLCILTFGDHLRLARQVFLPIERHCPRDRCRIIVGANAVCPETATFLRDRQQAGAIDHLIDSGVNIDKCPMMRRMLAAAETEFVWWFDDDSFITGSSAFDTWLEAARSAPPSIVQWGQLASCSAAHEFTDLPDPVAFVRSASWYRGLPPPSWRPGGKGEFDFAGTSQGDGRWLFILGGCWMMRTAALRALDWPDRRLLRTGDDVFLGEAIRQWGWTFQNLGTPHVALNTEPRRCPLRAPGASFLNPSPP